jgi:hypothetical protein
MNESPTMRAAVVSLIGVLLAGSLFATVLSGCRQTNGGRDSTSASAEKAPLSSRVHGCWTLRLQAQGTARDSLRAWLPAGSLPALVELDSAREASADEAPVYTAHSWFNDRRGSDPFSVWRPLGPDSIRVQRAGALAGVMLQLGPANDTLSGHVIVYRDVGRSNTTNHRMGPVTMTPARCPDA